MKKAYTEAVNLKVKPELLARIPNDHHGDRSRFIREAIEEKIAKNEEETKHDTA